MSIRLPEPSATEIVPHAIVDKTVARCSAEIETLEHRLEVALATARRNEERLAATSVGRVIDDDFEAAVLAVVERYADVIATGRFDPSALADPDRAALVLSAPSVGLPESAVDSAVALEPSEEPDVAVDAAPAAPALGVLGDFEPDAALDVLHDGVNGSTNGHAEHDASDDEAVEVANDQVANDEVAHDEVAHDDVAEHDVDAVDTAPAADVELDALVTSRRLRRRRGTTVVTRRDTALVPAVPVEDAPEHPEAVDAGAPIVDVAEPAADAIVPPVEATQAVEVVPAADMVMAEPADAEAVSAELVDDDSVEERHSGWPAHLLIHAGLILVVFALILFRLS